METFLHQTAGGGETPIPPSVGKRFPLQAESAGASFHETWTTGWRQRFLMFEPGPQVTPGRA